MVMQPISFVVFDIYSERLKNTLLMLVATAAACIVDVMLAGEVQASTSSLQSTPNAAKDVIPASQDVVPVERVKVVPSAHDDEIGKRLNEILNATGWFSAVQVDVNRGVVFLRGSTSREEQKNWAGELAAKTEDVVAVVNQIAVIPGPVWDLTPARTEVQSISRGVMQSLPLFAVAGVICCIAWVFAVCTSKLSKSVLLRRIDSPLLVDVMGRTAGFVAFLIGVYIALRVSGMTEVAATLLGGTGLLGLVVGIAFRDIAENLLASILISIQRPFAMGDFIELQGEGGYVQSVTMRGTLLMTLNGNHVQIPNSVVYKSTIRNLTANPNIRLTFDVAISYEDSITRVQDLILDVLRKHSAVLTDPEPLVLADTLGSTTVVMKVYFWINCVEHSKVKVRSALMRQVKRAAQDAGVTLADRGREFVAPKEIPIRIVRERRDATQEQVVEAGNGHHRALAAHVERAADRRELTRSEGGLEAEGKLIAEQAKAARTPDESPNLLAE